jgi:hypothetical protein
MPSSLRDDVCLRKLACLHLLPGASVDDVDASMTLARNNMGEKAYKAGEARACDRDHRPKDIDSTTLIPTPRNAQPAHFNRTT